MKNVYVLLINMGATLPEIEKHLLTKFLSKDYMLGFLDGYLFDQYKLLTVFEFEMKLKSGIDLNRCYVKFVEITEG